MINIKWLLLSLLISFCSQAQVFNSATGGITNNGVPTQFAINVTGLPLPSTSNTFGLVEVCLDISHPDMNEISIGLQSPQGKYVELVNNTSISGNSMGPACLNNSAGPSITLSNAPYTGLFKPTGYLGRFNDQSWNGVWYLIIKDYLPNSNAGQLNSASIKFSTNAPQPVNTSSSNLPLIFIKTNGQSLSTSTIVADLGIIDNWGARNNQNDARNNYNGKCLLNVRGSSSQIFEKKSYKIDLCTNDGMMPINATLLGMPAESDWVLTAGYSDKSLLRNALSHHVFRSMGHYSPLFRFTEVFINNNYAGVYTFLEKPKRGMSRVNVSKMESYDNNFPQITGGYIIQINRSDDAGWWSLFPGISQTIPSPKFYYQYVYPRAEDITDSQKNYIKAVLDSFEIALNSSNFSDAVNGYRKFIDVDSFVDMFILNEFSKNIDGYKLSTYLYKDNIIAGGKIHCGPAWDYDIAWKNANYGNADQPEWWQYDHPSPAEPLPTWWQRMLQDSYFRDRLYCRWHTFRLNVLKTANLHKWIDDNALLLSESQDRNFKTFPILDAYIFPVTAAEIKTNYSEIVLDLKDWIQERAEWLDKNMPGFCNNVGFATWPVRKPAAITILPNPFNSELKIIYDVPGSFKRKISITNVLGQILFERQSTEHLSENKEESIQLENLQEGSYFVTVEANGLKTVQKIVKN